MQAVILAAGRGLRMRPLSNQNHKTLIPVNGVALIDRLLHSIESVNVKRVLIVTGYDAENLEKHIREKFSHLDLEFVRNERYETTNNIVSLALAFEHLKQEDDLLLIEADLILDESILLKLIQNPAPDAALLDRHQPGMDGTVVTLDGGVITSVIPPHLQGAGFDFSDKYKTLNIYKFSANFCKTVFADLLRYYAKTVDSSVYYELILGILIYMKQVRIQAVLVEPKERWAELDDPNDLRLATWIFEPGQRLSLLEKSFGAYWNYDVIDFCFLRNMYWPTPAMHSELRRVLSNLMLNYGSTQNILNEKLELWLLCQPGRSVVLSGLSQIFPWLKQRYFGKKVLIPKPTFGEYSRIFPNAAVYEDKFDLPLEKLEKQLSGVDVCVVVSPNNPTGTEVDSKALHTLISKNRNVTFLVDESFQGFSEKPSLVSLLDESPLENVIVLSSLSKTLGVPGLRLGYVYSCDSEMVKEVNSMLPIWNLNSIAEYLLELGLKHRTSFEASLIQTRKDRAEFAKAIKNCRKVEKVIEGGANFVVIKLKAEAGGAASISEYLLANYNIYIKDISSKIGDGSAWFRIAVRLPEENLAFIKALQSI
ncbi:MAG: aminotransferase class I/II-fold pyridoxal phosphate-dependent enzyme [Leptospiraceae bacterium]|nr:aminotransferase class I/II-fold pyridoxal phosphate-dependent enzyme [Leptospiraceae bacterium]